MVTEEEIVPEVAALVWPARRRPEDQPRMPVWEEVAGKHCADCEFPLVDQRDLGGATEYLNGVQRPICMTCKQRALQDHGYPIMRANVRRAVWNLWSKAVRDRIEADGLRAVLKHGIGPVPDTIYEFERSHDAR